MHGSIRLMVLVVLVAGCTGEEFDIGTLAGSYVFNGDPACLVQVTGSHVSMNCTETSSDAYENRTLTRTAEFQFSESSVSGTYQEYGRQEWLDTGDVYEGTETWTLLVTKTSGGASGGTFSPFAGTWTFSGDEHFESLRNGVPDYSGGGSIAGSVQVAGDIAVIYDSDGEVLATASYTSGRLSMSGGADFFLLH